MEEKILYSVNKHSIGGDINKVYGSTSDLVEAVNFANRVCDDAHSFESICITETVDRTGSLDRHYSAQKLRLSEGSELRETPKVYNLSKPEDVEVLNEMLKNAIKEKANKQKE